MSIHKEILAVVGGGQNPAHERKTDVFDALLSDYFRVVHVDLAALTFTAVENSSVLIIATSLESATDSQLDDLIRFYNCANKTLILFHEAAIYNREHVFRQLLGVRFLKHPPYGKQKIRVGHPHFLTKGLPPVFETKDELYFFDSGSELSPYDTVFLSAENGHPVGFERHHRDSSSKLFYISIGHDRETFSKPAFQKLIDNFKFLSENFNKPIESGFREDSLLIEELKNNVTEPLRAVGRWNQLATDSREVYSQSGIFFPLDPAEYLSKIKGIDPGSVNQLTDDELKRILTSSLLSFEIRNTDYCNQQCYFCSTQRERGEDGVRDQIAPSVHRELEDSLIALKKKYNTPVSIRFSGAGDPSVHERTVEAIARFERNGIHTNLISNGTHFSEKQLTELSKYSKMIRFSFDAATPETYAKTHRSKDFDVVLHNFKRLSQLRKLFGRKEMFLGATFLICPENYHEIEMFSKLIKAAGADLVWIKAINNKQLFSDKQLCEIDESINNATALSDNGFYVSATRYKVARSYENIYRANGRTCWSMFTKAFLQPNGDLAICLSHKDIILGNIATETVEEMWGGEKHRRLIREKVWEKCLGCFEARFNASVDFMYENREFEINKVFAAEHDL